MKLRYELIPFAPLRELVRAYTIGAEKYEDDDWKTKYTSSQVYGKLMRHLEAWRSGEDRADDGQYHLAAVAFHAFTLLWYSMFRPEAEDIQERKKAA